MKKSCEEVKIIVKTSEDYKFIWEQPTILVSIGGSYAYGTNTDNSDVDVRGIVLEPRESIIGLSPFEQHEVHNKETGVDVVLYGARKMTNLLLGNNPNCVEILSPQDRNIIYKNKFGEALIENRHDFLSQKLIYTFGAYAKAQFDRMENAMARDRYDQPMVERHMLNSILGMMKAMNTRYKEMPEGGMTLEIVDSEKDDLEKEIVVNCNLKKYPLRDFKSIWSDMQNIVKDYSKLDGRNKKKDDAHLNKHCMHLVRLLLMGIDLCEKEEIITYRENDIDLLMSIRNGDYMKDGVMTQSFYDLVDKLNSHFEKAASETKLPKKPNFHKVENMLMKIYEEYLH